VLKFNFPCVSLGQGFWISVFAFSGARRGPVSFSGSVNELSEYLHKIKCCPTSVFGRLDGGNSHTHGIKEMKMEKLRTTQTRSRSDNLKKEDLLPSRISFSFSFSFSFSISSSNLKSFFLPFSSVVSLCKSS